MYALYDDVLLLREGRVVFHGPREAVPAYMAGIGFPPPSPAMGAPGAAAEEDVADWLLSVITHPHGAHAKARAAADAAALLSAGLSSSTSLSRLDTAQHTEGEAAAAEGGDSPLSEDAGALSPVTPGPVTPVPGASDALPTPPPAKDASTSSLAPPLTTLELAHAWEGSALCAQRAKAAQADPVEPLALASPFARAQYGAQRVRSVASLAATLLARRESGQGAQQQVGACQCSHVRPSPPAPTDAEWKLTMRNTMYVVSQREHAPTRAEPLHTHAHPLCPLACSGAASSRP